MEAEAEAEAIALKGDAEAFAIECKAKAEAEQMAKKADAWKEYKEAAMVDMMLQTLPKVGFIAFIAIIFGYNYFRLLPKLPLHFHKQKRSLWSVMGTGRLVLLESLERFLTSW